MDKFFIRSRFMLGVTVGRFRDLWNRSPQLSVSKLRADGLEDRILLSAAPLVAPIAVAEPIVATQFASPLDAGSIAAIDQQVARHELVIIDSAVADVQALIDDLQSRDDPSRHLEFVLLDGGRDGIEQISELLGDAADLDAIHLVSHGQGGQVKLGNTWLNSENLAGYAGDISNWGSALREGADLLIYGCDLGDTASGRSLVESLSALCNCDVAASTDDTGHANYGANWQLEFQTGDIQTQVAFSAQLQQEWQSKLAVINVDTFADVVDGGDGLTSLREAIIQVNGGPGGDTIVLQAGTYSLSIIGSGEDGAATGDLDILKDVTITGDAASTTIVNAFAMAASPDRVFDLRAGTASFFNLTIRGGQESMGGGISTQTLTTLNLTDVEVRDNTATGDGGGILNRETLNLNRVTIADNASGSNGGGIHFANAGTGMLTNVTISGNTAVTGGGIFNDNGTVTLVNSTIAANSTGIGTQGGHVTQLKNTILDNLGANADTGLSSLGFNVDSDGTALLGDPLDGFDPLLGALTTNAGTTRTHALLAGSPAINTGTVGGAPAADQRGVSRVANVDIGAFESTSNILVVDTTSDVVDAPNTSTIADLLSNIGADNRISLREAILATNGTANGVTPDEIHFNIPDNDLGHLYYQDDFSAGALSTVANTNLSDELVGDFDPDYPYAKHSWFRIDLDNAQPQLEIADAVIINGFTQQGATPNTLPVGNDARLRIELTNSAGESKRGLTFLAGGAGSSVFGLVINDFGGSGILTEPGADNITVQGNFIGTDVTGTIDVGNGDAGVHLRSNSNLVGGTRTADRNLISGNDSRGVTTFTFGPIATGNKVQNNYIGVDATGVRGLGNSGSAGVQIYNNDGFQLLDNVIGDSNGYGVWLRNSTAVINTVIQGNLIGVGADGLTNVGNNNDGIYVEEAVVNTVIGGVLAGEANVIAHNDGDGIRIDSGIGTSIRGNSIFDNDELGIDLLGNNGVTGNDIADLDAGPNGLQNYPVLTAATISGFDLTITGSLNSTPNTAFDFDFFASTTPDGTSHGEAERYLASAVGISTDGSGNLTLNELLSGVNVTAGQFITATATSQFGNTSEFSFNVVAAGMSNTAPTITSDGGATGATNVAENTTMVTTITASDPEAPPQVVTFAIIGGADAARFSLNGSTGALTFVVAPNFEIPTDTDTDNVYEVTIEASDGVGGTHAQNLSVTVTDANDAPIITSSLAPSLIENSTVVQTLTATDPDGDVVSFNITGGADGGHFVINGSNQLVFVAAPDFESPTDTGANNTYEVQITADDGNLGTDVRTVLVSVTNQNELPTLTSSLTPSLVENSTVVQTLTATDPDGDVVSFSITGGADGGHFVINGSNQLVFVAAPDFESPTDTGANNTYEVQITADDGNLGTDVRTVLVSVTNQNELPTLTSSLTPSLVENSTVVQTLTATDPDGDVVSFNITGGADGGHFFVNGSNQLVFVAAPDFESPTDTGANNTYEVQITADDGNLGTDVRTVSVTINPLNDNSPSFTILPTANVMEGTTFVATVNADDADLPVQIVTFAIVGGSDAAHFMLLGGMDLTFVSAADFAVPADADSDNVYEVDVLASDGAGGTALLSMAVTVNELPAPPLSGLPKSSTPVSVSHPDDETEERIALMVGAKSSSSNANEPQVLLTSLAKAASHFLTLDANTGTDADGMIPVEVNLLAQAETQPYSKRWGLLQSRSASETQHVDGAINIAASFIPQIEFWQSLDEMKAKAHQLGTTTIILGSTMFSGVGLSVGYAIWMVRGGLLASSLIAQMPAWKLIDPLMLLDSDQFDATDGDDESLQSILEDHQSDSPKGGTETIQATDDT